MLMLSVNTEVYQEKRVKELGAFPIYIFIEIGFSDKSVGAFFFYSRLLLLF